MSLTTKILAALLVIQLGALGVRALGSGDRAGSRATSSGAPIVSDVTASQVARLEIKDDKGEKVVLAKSGDAWVAESAHGYPTRPDAVMKIIEKIVGVKSVGVVATQKRSHAALEVADGKVQRDVRLSGADGKELAHILFGKAAGGGAFVRRAETDDVHRSDGAITWELSTSPSAYIDTQLTSFDPSQVQSFTIERKGATPTAVERGPDDGWRVRVGAPAPGESPAATTGSAAAESALEFPAAKEKVDEVLRTASRCWFSRVAAAKPAPEHGVDPAECLLTFKLKDATEVKIALGKRAADGHNVFAKKSGSDFVVELSEGTLGGLEKEAEFFRPAPPAPAPAAPGAPDAPMMPGGGLPTLPGK